MPTKSNELDDYKDREKGALPILEGKCQGVPIIVLFILGTSTPRLLYNNLGDKDMTDKTFDQIYTEYSPKLKVKFSKKIRDEQEVEDLVQDTMILISKGLPSYDSSTAALSTWLYTVANNCMINHFKTRSRRPVLTTVPELHDNEYTESFDSPDNILSAEETLATINKAATRMNPDFADVYTLREIEGYSTKETALKLGITEGTVKTRYKRAKDYIKEKVNG